MTMSQILIVDDQQCVRRLLWAQLTLAGYSATDADSAEAARTYLSSRRPELVLLDLYLNGPEGFELLAEIKARYPDVPVVVVTAYDRYKKDPRLSKADGYFVKSFDFEGLVGAIGEILGKETETRGRDTLGSPSPSPLFMGT